MPILAAGVIMFKCKNCGKEVNRVPMWRANECPGQMQHTFKEMPEEEKENIHKISY